MHNVKSLTDFITLWAVTNDTKSHMSYAISSFHFQKKSYIVVLTSIAFTYSQLNSQDYRWWWRSFFYGG